MFIYTLSSSSDPSNIRYIGKSKDLKDRLRRHVSKYNLNREINYKNNWIKFELNQRNSIIIEILEEVCENNWIQREIYWIEQFRQWGFNLTNSTKGGEGILLNNDIIKKRNDANTLLNNQRLEIQMKKFNIYQDKDGLWLAERTCKCEKVIKYKSMRKSTILLMTRRADNEKRVCNKCKLLGEKSHFYGKKLNDGVEKKGKYGKVILQFDNNDNLLNEYASIREASEKTGIDRKSISNCARGVKYFNTAKGFKFKIKEI